MNYRTASVLAAKDLGAAGTEPIEIRLTDVISRLVISFQTTKSKDGMDSYTHKNISKIELVDGSDVLHSMNGGENQALCIFDRKAPTMQYGSHIIGAEWDLYGIDFGRYLFDPMLALDPKRFKNLVLNITWDENVADTGVLANLCAVYAECFDQKIVSPMGFLMSKEHWNAAKPTAGYEYIQLPTDHPIRKMLIQPYRAGYEPWYQVSEARLDEDNEKRIPFDWDLETYYFHRQGIDPPINETFVGVAINTGANVFYVTPTDYFATPSLMIYGNENFYIGGGVPKGGKFTPYTQTSGTYVQGIIHGWLPNHCFHFPFGDEMNIEDWYDVSKVQNLRLRLKAGTGASTTTGVVLQQLRSY